MQNESPRLHRALRRLARIASFCILHSALCISLLPLSGCTLFSVLAGKVAPEPTVPAQYDRMQGQSVAVMVWADEGTMIDFPNVRLDVAGSLQKKLEQGRDAKARELKGVTFPTPPASVVRFQENHPELEGAPVTDLARHVGATRVVYVELDELQTRSDASVELFRGSGSATVRVVEVSPDGSAKIAYEETGISAVFPPTVGEEGTPNGNDARFYAGTVNELTSAIAKRFVPHKQEQ